MLRFGFRLHSGLDFNTTLGAPGPSDRAAVRQHNNDLKGRLGFVLVVVGIGLQAVSSYCVWMAAG
ncbi:MAG TPA: hypothetical protein VFB13_20115 [Reyranella sp.]|nr:hypothetical protein [Reyranella sp.]